MEIKRRDFLKGLAGSAVLAVASPAMAASSEKSRLPDALGILYDSTLCVGCQVCMVAWVCQRKVNFAITGGVTYTAQVERYDFKAVSGNLGRQVLGRWRPAAR